MKLLRTKSLDVWRNLAVEDALLARAKGAPDPLLFLWQSRNAVVIGKNQNPWREAHIPLMQDEACALARRISGGGAVYHDEGNLNYTFIMDRRRYRQEKVFELVVDALRALGFDAARMGKTSLGVRGRKVSGNAFCFKRGAALHHGTLLVSSDLGKMSRYLRRGASAIQTRAIASEPAETVNLRKLDPGIGMEEFKAALVKRAGAEFGEVSEQHGDEWIERLMRNEECEKMASWAWVYGHTPPFEFDVVRELSGMEVQLSAHVSDGMLREAGVRARGKGSDAYLLESRLQGVRFDASEIAGRLRPAAGPLAQGFEYAIARAFVTV